MFVRWVYESSSKAPQIPECGKYYAGYPVLSREDNKTEICPECGIKEAISIFKLSLKYLEIDRFL